MNRSPSSSALIRAAATAIGIALPTLTLAPFGSVWLYQQGYLLHWAVAITLIIGLLYAWQRRFLSRAIPAQGNSHVPPDVGDAEWSAAEQQAWQDVLAVARDVDPSQLSSREALLTVATRTIRTVAKRLHPEVSEPVWQFTLPEALAITERVSRRLSVFAIDHVPLVDRLTIARILSLYRWRSAIDVAERAYDVWRVIRLVNPMAAATNELRERLSRDMLNWGREHVMRQLTEAYIKEIGRAAIDLYGGRLRVDPRLQAVEDFDKPNIPPDRRGLRRIGSQTVNAGRAFLKSFRRS